MKKFNKSLMAGLVAAGMVASFGANATNGYFAHGVGMKAKGMAGAGIAYGQDALAAGTNPANSVLVGGRIDFGVDLFKPVRTTSITGFSGAYSSYNGSYSPNKDDMFLIPEFGYNSMIDNVSSWGVSVFGNGGMNTSYKKPIAWFGSTNAGVNLEQLYIAPNYSRKLNDKNAIGVAVNLIYQKFKATGLQNFNDNAHTSHVGSVSDNGDDTSTGYSLRLGWTGTINDMVTVGLTYQSKADMKAFDKYKGLFAENGKFDIPSTYGVGIAVKASPRMNVALDITKINYSEVKSISNPNPGTNLLGTAGGSGFGWQDMTVYKLGFDYQYSDSLVLRAGWNHGDQPIPANQTLFNLLAPGVVEDHLTLGATWTLANKAELTVAYMHAFEKTVNGSQSIRDNSGNVISGAEANLKMSQDSLGVAYGWKF